MNDATVHTSWWRGLVFRIGFLFWSLHCIRILATDFESFDWFRPVAVPVLRAIVTWIGQCLFGVTPEISSEPSGSSDRTADWLWLFGTIVVAILGGLLWAVLDRRRAYDPRLRAYLRLAVRYTLAFVMIDFGIAKVLGRQFSTPSVWRLSQLYGDSSPMGLLWTFMGQSSAYQVFGGLMELGGALLLLFRRTAMLGALVVGAVSVNVVMLNFCYDVCLKIESSMCLAACGFLLLPDARRLLDLLRIQRPTELQTKRKPVVKLGVITLFIGALLYSMFHTDAEYAARFKEPARWYGGYWKVTAFTRDGRDRPIYKNDPVRWQRIRFQPSSTTIWMRWRKMDNGNGPLYEAVFDEVHEQIHLTPSPEENRPPEVSSIDLHYTRLGPTRWRLEGMVDGAQLVVELEPFDAQETILRSRGFHWISEEAYNR